MHFADATLTDVKEIQPLLIFEHIVQLLIPVEELSFVIFMFHSGFSTNTQSW